MMNITLENEEYTYEGGQFSFGIGEDYAITVNTVITGVDKEYSCATYEDGFMSERGGYVIERVYTDHEIDTYYFVDEELTRSEFIEKSGMSETELEEIEKSIIKTAVDYTKEWAMDNPDEVL